MHPATVATLGIVLFWIAAIGIKLLLRDSDLDPVAGMIASAIIGIVVYRAANRHSV